MTRVLRLPAAALLAALAACQPLKPPERPAPASAPVEQPAPKPALAPAPPACPPAPACVCPPTPQCLVPAKPTPKPKPKPAPAADTHGLPVLGGVEMVEVDPPGVKLAGRLDTGAQSCSLHAVDVVPFDRDGARWVRFVIADKVGEGKVIERPVVRTVLIKRHDAEPQRRFVVKLNLRIGKIDETVDVTLADRGDFDYPVLVGRNFLTDNAIVDVSRKFINK